MIIASEKGLLQFFTRQAFLKGMIRLKKTILCLIRFYQKHISPIKRVSSCRFIPTCSEYAAQAVEKYGAWKGGGLALWRILRCNPLCKSGYDPLK